jgi:FkbM family methyltransferase
MEQEEIASDMFDSAAHDRDVNRDGLKSLLRVDTVDDDLLWSINWALRWIIDQGESRGLGRDWMVSYFLEQAAAWADDRPKSIDPALIVYRGDPGPASVTRALVERVNELLDGLAGEGPVRACIRKLFGITTGFHETVLRQAYHHGRFTRRDAFFSANNGRYLNARLGTLRTVPAVVMFQTEWGSRPQEPIPEDGVSVAEIYTVDTGRAQYKMLVANPVELTHAGMHEQLTIEWLDQTLTPTSVLLDVGANVGSYSLYACATCPGAASIALEPMPYTYARLCQNIRLNAFPITSFPFAASDETKIVDFEVGDGLPGASGLAGIQGTAGHSASGCQCYRLDDFMDAYARCGHRPEVSHLKIDVDGPDLLALRGAARTLREARHVSIESSGHSAAREITDFLATIGYTLAREDTNRARFGNLVFIRQG